MYDNDDASSSLNPEAIRSLPYSLSLIYHMLNELIRFEKPIPK